MQNTNNRPITFVLLLLLFVVTILLNLGLGSVKIPLSAIIDSFLGKEIKHSWEIILWNYRLPKAITTILVGSGLSLSGLLMQTFFRNPLAGPYVLGLSSGSSLGVALVVMGSGFLPSFFFTDFSIIIASSIGSFVVLIAVLSASQKLRDTMAILVVGLMFSSFTGAMVSVLSYFSTAEELQKFTFWSMGSLANLSWNSILMLASCCFIGIFLALLILKPLDAMLLGENYAKTMGVNHKKSSRIIIIATSIISGSITAFVGPIAFVGLAVPHIAKLIFQTSNHFVLFRGVLLLGSILMLICDSIAQFPGSDFTLPINAITSLVGAPLVVWLLIRKNKLIN